MIRRFIERCENFPVGPGQWFLTFLAFALIRLHVEILYLDFRRTPEFFILNIGYFLSLVLSIALMLKFLSGEYLPRILRTGLPFSAIVLLPLLDLFFYPNLRGDDLLDICRIPVFAKWQGYAIYFVAEMLSHTFFLNPRTALGLRLEILTGGVVVFLYIFCKARSRLAGVLKGMAAYLLYLSLVYVHAVLVLHPATRAWIFPPFVLAELMLCIGLWKARALTEFVSRIAWPVVLFLAGGMAIGYGLSLQTEAGAGGMGEILAAACGLIALGVFAGAAEVSEGASPMEGLHRWARNLSPVFCVLAVYPVHRYVFLSFTLLLGLIYLGWFSPFKLARLKVILSLAAGLAFWISAWTGQIVLSSGLVSPQQGMPASMEGMRLPKGNRPFPGRPFPPPPWDRGPGPGSRFFPGDDSRPEASLPDRGRNGPMNAPLDGPPGPDLDPDRMGNAPPPPRIFGMSAPPTDGETPPFWPDWLYHPLWLATPLVFFGILTLRKSRKLAERNPGAD